MKVLIIEDDKDIAELVQYNLSNEKFETEVANDGLKGLKKAKKSPDLIILDLMLPGMSGLDVCKSIKGDETTQHIPILMLSAKSEEIDRVLGLELGADDYLTKPFSPRELVLRVKAILKRFKPKTKVAKSQVIQFGDLTVDEEKYEVTVKGTATRLTAIEFKLLTYLLHSKGRVATRDRLLDSVWGYESALTTRTVDTHIKRLRQKLKSAGQYIETIRGIGYRFLENP